MNKQDRLKTIPPIDQLLDKALKQPSLSALDRDLLKDQIRHTVEVLKALILQDRWSGESDRTALSNWILNKTIDEVNDLMAPSLKPLINCTGIVLHTNLGRAPLSQAARESIETIIQGYVNLEIDLNTGKRGHRRNHVADLLCRITGAEDVAVVNNNAAAVFLALNTMTFQKEAIISRGELVEIGGSFRMPEVMEKSGSIMREVGSTNKTKATDYENAINDKTGALVVAHTSNYRILGFTEQVPLPKVVEIAHRHHLPVLHDIGGGILFDLTTIGLPDEPLVQDSIIAGTDVVTFSGDKVLGGPQCGIIAGKKEWIEKINSNPVMRAMRCDKLVYAALEATLKLYLQPKTLMTDNKTLRYLAQTPESIKKRCQQLMNRLSPDLKNEFQIDLEESEGQTGSGALPLETLPGYAVVMHSQQIPAEKLARHLRLQETPVIGYIKNERLFLDLRTVDDDMLDALAAVLNSLATF
ncbi:L-seryl-tRNA(Sec) selenium transferase [candidate division KSB1 bacterium]|nr:L-seryl-tRNA(Sec) selenium transferase [candidate division KSB1 bacterium]